jgi:cyanophycin synthetase
LQALGKFLRKVESPRKVGVVAGVGDRRDEDTISLGVEAAHLFDEIVIRQDKNLRGKSGQEIIDLITKGIHSVDPNKIVHAIPNEVEAINFVMDNATKDSFITICSDVVPIALDMIIALKEAEDTRALSRGF